MELNDLAKYANEKYQIIEEFKWEKFPNFSVLCNPSSLKWIALFMRQWDTDSGEEIECCDIRSGRDTLLNYHESYINPPIRMHGHDWVNIRFHENTNPKIVFELFEKARALTDDLKQEKIYHGRVVNKTYADTPLSFKGDVVSRNKSIVDTPQRIKDMKKLFHYEITANRTRTLNFYRQGKFMEEFEDDYKAEGEIKYSSTYPTYHDFSFEQLRCYFTWRTSIRKHVYYAAPENFVYMYMSELFSGIGSTSALDAVEKLKEFIEMYQPYASGTPYLLDSIHQCMFEYCMMHQLPLDGINLPIDTKKALEEDDMIGILKDAQKYSDTKVCMAIDALTQNKLFESPVFKKDQKKAEYLYAKAWNVLLQKENAFEKCFGKLEKTVWNPLRYVVYYDQFVIEDTTYQINETRSYQLSNGTWYIEKYYPSAGNKRLFRGFVHGTEMLLRKYMNAGRDLKNKPEDAWVIDAISDIIQTQKEEDMQALSPKVEIDLSNLEKIRIDASITRDNLLTDEERLQDIDEVEPETNTAHQIDGLDEIHTQILMHVVENKDITQLLRDHHLMASIVMDTINEALFDTIGDNVLEMDDDQLRLVEDYREEVLEELGG
ncbi:MAG: TerB N-terminal domain-containing protein [Erysipelotrichaceae bacterium]|nr:TerB N-terminal domain-containing protein [Erysipelotrichaceae bacterium]